jgi:hypothetical protein
LVINKGETQMTKTNAGRFKVIADPDLPKAERRRAGDKNPLIGKVFDTHEAARMALYYSEVPVRQYKVVEFYPVGVSVL